MRGFVFTNGWVVQITNICVSLALRQIQQLHFFLSNQSRASAFKVACVIMKVRGKSCLTVALQLFDKNPSLCFHYKTLCQIKTFPTLISYSLPFLLPK